jgi:hypothetical protein
VTVAAVATVNTPFTLNLTPSAPGLDGSVTYSLQAVPGSALPFDSSATIDPTTGLFSWTPGQTGTYQFEVVATGANGGTATQLLNVTVGLANQTAVTAVLSSSAGSDVVTTDASVTFTLTVTPATASKTPLNGSVQFYINGTAYGTAVALVGGQASIQTQSTQLPVGSDSITAVYSGDDNYLSAQGSLTQVVEYRTATAVTGGTSVSGQGVSFTATVTRPNGSAVPGGTVQFQIDGQSFGSPVALSNGQATSPTVSTLSVNPTGQTHTVTAVYGGDANDLTSTGGATQTVNRDGVTATVSSATAPSVFGQGVSFTVVVAAQAPGDGTPTGSVQFLVDGADLGGPVTLGGTGQAVSAVTTALAVGSHTVTVSYSGDGNFLATGNGSPSTIVAVDQVVAQAQSSTAVVSSNAVAVFGQGVTFTATVNAAAPGAGAPTGSVDFRDTTTGADLGTVTLTAGSATLTTAALGVGAHAITAAYLGDTNFQTSSGGVNQAVSQDTTTTIVSSSAVNDASVFGQEVTFTAVVAADAPGAGTPGGSVDFYDTTTGTDLTPGGVALAGGSASMTTSALAVGAHNIQASYLGDPSFQSGSGSLMQTVNPDGTTTVVSLPAADEAVAFGQSVSLTATVSAAAPGAGTPTGSVEFFINGTPYTANPVSLTGGQATIETALPVGSNTVTATYDGDANFQTSTSAGLDPTVSDPTSVTVSASTGTGPS